MVDVAQLVEPRIVIPAVAGSSPVVHPTSVTGCKPGRLVFSKPSPLVRCPFVEVFHRGPWKCLGPQLLAQPEQFIFQCFCPSARSAALFILILGDTNALCRKLAIRGRRAPRAIDARQGAGDEGSRELRNRDSNQSPDT
jgi:hypothetical protein